MLSVSPTVLYARSVEGGFPLSYVSDAVEHLLGYPAEELRANPEYWSNIIHADDLDRVLERQLSIFETRVDSDEYRFLNKAGEYVWIRDDFRLVSDKAGQPLEIVGSWSQADQQKRDEAVHIGKLNLAELFSRYIEHTSGTSLDTIISTSLDFMDQHLAIPYADLLVKQLEPGHILHYRLGTGGGLLAQEIEYSQQRQAELSGLMKTQGIYYRPEIEQSNYSVWDDPQFVERGMKSSLLVPLCMENNCLGVLRLYSNRRDGFEERLRDFFPLLAPSLTQLIHNASLYDRLLDEQAKLKQAVDEREQALYELNRFRRVLDSPDDAVFLIDPELMSFIDFNKSAVGLFGYSEKELSQMGLHSLTPEYDHGALQDIFHRVISENIEAFDITTLHLHKDGRQIPVEIRLSPFVDKVNKNTIIAMVRDVSDRIKIAEELRQSEERWRSMAANSPDQIFLLDLGLNIKFLNYPVPGMTAEELVGQSVMSFVPAECLDEAQRCFDEVRQKGIASSFCSSLISDGETVYYESYVGPIKRDDEVTALVVNARDITQRKQDEDKLRQSAVAVDNAGEGVLVTDTHNHIVSINRAFTEITFYSEEETLGQHHSLLRSDRHDDAFYAALWQEVHELGRWQGELWSRRKNGEDFPAWSTISTVRDSEGEITNYVLIFSDISVIKTSQDKLDFMAHHDPLTSLPNRLLFTDRLEHALQRANRQKDKVAVFFIDLDRFKNINDTLGHPVGDKLIQQAAERLSNVVREDDTVARLGGDEFIIALEGFNQDHDVDILARKVIDAFQYPFIVDEHELHVTLSLGVSMYPADGQDGETLIKNADVAMYRAKEEGRNNYNFYTLDLASSVFERLALESALRKALERDELSLVYQPQYCLDGDKVVGCESLMRWDNPALGIVSPSRFVPIAEDSGLIVELGRWGLITACSQMKRWLLAGAAIQHMAVNVSAVQLQRSDFVTTVKSALEETGLEARYLELEVTESVIMHNADYAIDILDELKELGVGLAIDDFGTGYSSLSYLKRLPVDKLKIDRSFVSDIPHDTNDMEIARAVIALASSLGLQVIAEGLETEEQRQFMIAEGSQHAQGYLFGKPITGDEFFSQFLRKNCHLN